MASHRAQTGSVHVVMPPAAKFLRFGQRHTKPKRKRGGSFRPSLALRVSVSLGRERYSGATIALLSIPFPTAGEAARLGTGAFVVGDGQRTGNNLPGEERCLSPFSFFAKCWVAFARQRVPGSLLDGWGNAWSGVDCEGPEAVDSWMGSPAYGSR